MASPNSVRYSSFVVGSFDSQFRQRAWSLCAQQATTEQTDMAIFPNKVCPLTSLNRLQHSHAIYYLLFFRMETQTAVQKDTTTMHRRGLGSTIAIKKHLEHCYGMRWLGSLGENQSISIFQLRKRV